MRKSALFILPVFFLTAFSLLIVFISLCQLPVYATDDNTATGCDPDDPNCNPLPTEVPSPSYTSVGKQFNCAPTVGAIHEFQGKKFGYGDVLPNQFVATKTPSRPSSALREPA